MNHEAVKCFVFHMIILMLTPTSKNMNFMIIAHILHYCRDDGNTGSTSAERQTCCMKLLSRAEAERHRALGPQDAEKTRTRNL